MIIEASGDQGQINDPRDTAIHELTSQLAERDDYLKQVAQLLGESTHLIPSGTDRNDRFKDRCAEVLANYLVYKLSHEH